MIGGVGTLTVEVEDTDAGPALVIHMTDGDVAAHLVTRDPRGALALAKAIALAGLELADKIKAARDDARR